MRYELRPIITEIEELQNKVGKAGRHIQTVYLTEGEMDEFALECKAIMNDDSGKVLAHADFRFRWKGTIIKREQKP